MYHPVRRKSFGCVLIVISLAIYVKNSVSTNIDDDNYQNNDNDINFDNNILDFDSTFNDKLYKNDWNGQTLVSKGSNSQSLANKVESRLKETDIDTVKDKLKSSSKKDDGKNDEKIVNLTKLEPNSYMLHVVPLMVTTKFKEDIKLAVETTTEYDLTVIPLTTSEKNQINETVVITTESFYMISKDELNITTTQNVETTESVIGERTQRNIVNVTLNESDALNSNQTLDNANNETSMIKKKEENNNKTIEVNTPRESRARSFDKANESMTTLEKFNKSTTESIKENIKPLNSTVEDTTTIAIKTNVAVKNKTDDVTGKFPSKEVVFNSTMDTSKEAEDDVATFSELDLEDLKDVPEDFYDGKDVIPTKPPSTDALSVIFGLAGSVVESVAERVVPKGLMDLFKRMQKQNEALEAERLRSREENGGIGQFTRGILKSISSGLTKPLNQLMAGVRDIGSLDTDRGFVSSVASGVSSVANVANSLSDAFKNRVQAIYPGTIWCGDGHSAQARSSELGLFFFTDTCCRQHDACKIFIKAGETKYGLTNTGLFTRSHCSCDQQFRECLRKTNSLVSSQIGLTYFNVLGPQCFRKAHPIVRCTRKTRLTGQKCEEYELDYTKEKMWQWFDNETF